ncbi:hypothetical protein [Pseudonocardia sp. HH130630-07]|uniref:hypothetical protein n=1 Tax=Pseudonocardia sp. HH130630-07 TaxID=1690815 RepID=UPI000814CE24|nr:hypothetical protein [Pseudonocardia sp. HH130630-07]ANY05531.1 hypothetical protein AFB00_03555 [Pseudonocardia sp. HH130630-07]
MHECGRGRRLPAVGAGQLGRLRRARAVVPGGGPAAAPTILRRADGRLVRRTVDRHGRVGYRVLGTPEA